MIIKKPESNENSIILSFDNGDIKALKEAIDKFSFVDEQAALRFALFALLKAEKNVLYVDEGNKKVVLTPSQQLIKPSATSDEQKTVQ